MTGDEITLREHFDARFDDFEESMDLKITAALVGVVRWKDLFMAITGSSALVGVIFAIITAAGHGAG